MLNIIDDLLGIFHSNFGPFTCKVVHPVFYCLTKASRDLTTTAVLSDGELDITEGRTMKVSLLRTVRQHALQILARMTESCPEYRWHPYSAAIIKEIVEPRLEKFPIETAQSVSGLLRLFAAWSKSPLTAPFLVEHNQAVLTKIIDCLEVSSAKDEVKKFVLDDILGNIILLVSGDEDTAAPDDKFLRNRLHTDIIQPYSNAIISKVGALLRQSPSKEVLESGVHLVASLAPHIVGSTESRSMIEIATFLLRQPSKRVSPRTKSALLKILHEFMQRHDSEGILELFDNIFDAICPMFSFVQDQTARNLLCDIVHDLSQTRDDLVATARLCQDLNSFAKSRLDEPDFERRASAFAKITEADYQTYSLVQWKPLVRRPTYEMNARQTLTLYPHLLGL